MKKVIVLLLLFALVSCENKEQDQIVLSVNPTSLSFSGDNGQETVIVTSPSDWILTGGADWCHASVKSGNNGDKVVISVDPNYSEPREAEYSFSIAGATAPLTIKQAKKQVITISEAEKEKQIDYDEDTLVIELSTNTEYKYSIDVDWIHFVETKALNQQTLVFHIDENQGEDDRLGHITLSGEGVSCEVTIKQKAKEVAQINTIYDIDADGGTLSIDFVTNIEDFTVSVDSNADWVKFIETKGISTKVLSFSVEANDLYEKRQAPVRILSGDKVLCSFIIEQTAHYLPSNIILYTTKYGYPVSLINSSVFGEARLMENIYENGYGKLVFDNDVTVINKNAFSDQKTITSIVLPETVEEIGENAFSNCTAMETFTLPKSIKTINDNAFKACTGVIYVNCDIPNNAFIESSFSSFIIDNSVTVIGERAFYGLSSLEGIQLPSSLKTISKEAFSNTSLKEIVFPATLVSIGESAFMNCNNLLSVIIPSNVNTIKGGAFANCSKLSSVVFEDGNVNLYIGAYDNKTGVFQNTALTTIVLPDRCRELGKLVFSGSKLQSVTISPNSNLNYIYEAAFKGLYDLESIFIPKRCNRLYDSAFYGCPLKSVKTEVTYPPTLGASAFSDRKNSCSLEVPEGKEIAYYMSSWSNYFSINNLPGEAIQTEVTNSIDCNYAIITGKIHQEFTKEGYQTAGVCFGKTPDFDFSEYAGVIGTVNDYGRISYTALNLHSNTTYYYKAFIKNGDIVHYGEVLSFTTPEYMISPYANCYVVKSNSEIRFPAFKGNAIKLDVGEVASVSVYWETVGTKQAPTKNTIVKSVSCANNMITVSTGKAGNAVVAAMDKNGVILWSWHIWVTDDNLESYAQTLNNNSGVMMDRNLGALSERGAQSIGLQYQNGRKDPFPGAHPDAERDLSLATMNIKAQSVSNISNVVQYSIENPFAFLYKYQNSSRTPYSFGLWYEDEKSVYDPCPPGWRVSGSSFWTTALGEQYFDIVDYCGKSYISCSSPMYYMLLPKSEYGANAFFPATGSLIYDYYQSSLLMMISGSYYGEYMGGMMFYYTPKWDGGDATGMCYPKHGINNTGAVRCIKE